MQWAHIYHIYMYTHMGDCIRVCVEAEGQPKVPSSEISSSLLRQVSLWPEAHLLG